MTLDEARAIRAAQVQGQPVKVAGPATGADCHHGERRAGQAGSQAQAAPAGAVALCADEGKRGAAVPAWPGAGPHRGKEGCMTYTHCARCLITAACCNRCANFQSSD